ncbi:MAG TPA: helix-turn-helix domain-containing protein [Rummeliibacillus sp.]|nr:helix-turn-helix domain-containing protein [Rummeliibacillus sp.]
MTGLLKFLTSQEVAKILNYHPRTIPRLAKKGHLKGIKIGRKWLFDPNDYIVDRKDRKEDQ